MKEYGFRNSVFYVNGVEITGYGQGDSVLTFARRNDSASDVIGIDGEMSISLSSDLSGESNFNLMQTSDSNIYLSGLIAAQENGLFVPIFCQYKDTRGGDLASGTQGYLKRPADMVRGATVNEQSWMIVVERLDLLHGGG